MFFFFLIFFIFNVLAVLYLVLIERKLLALVQRRKGPSALGRNGILQIFADLFKLLSKELTRVSKLRNLKVFFFIFFYFIFSLFVSQIAMTNTNFFFFCEANSVILYQLILISLCNTMTLLIGYAGGSKFSLLGAARLLVYLIAFDLFMSLLFSLLSLEFQSFNMHDWMYMQSYVSTFFLIFPLCFCFIVWMLAEAKRTPFDHVENENELVAGYNIEYSGSILMIIYLVEYFHVFYAAVCFCIIFLGGSFLNINFIELFSVPFGIEQYILS